jgi:hypothetical protein
MADSGPEYGLEALRTATEARTATPPGTDPASLSAGGFSMPGLDFSFSAPSFLSDSSRWVLFLVLGAGGFFALWLAFQITVTAPADADAARYNPALLALGVALLAFVLAYLTVMGFGSVVIKTTIGEGGGGGGSGGGGSAGGLTVTDTVPPKDATGIGVNAQIEATFSRAIAPASVTTSTFTLTKSGERGRVPATVTVDADGKSAGLKPNANLDANAEYEARITKAVKAADGKTLAADKIWSFRTAA